jgi:hypothetical protein
MGAATFTDNLLRKIREPEYARVRIIVTPSSSYATGGDTITWTTALGLTRIDTAWAMPVIDTTGVYIGIPDFTNNKIKIVNVSDGVEVTATTDLDAFKFTFELYGRE